MLSEYAVNELLSISRIKLNGPSLQLMSSEGRTPIKLVMRNMSMTRFIRSSNSSLASLAVWDYDTEFCWCRFAPINTTASIRQMWCILLGYVFEE